MLIESQQRLDNIIKTPKIVFGEHEINRVREKTVLGLIIDDQLNWNKHNNEQCKKISKSIALLRKAKDFVSQEELVKIYNSLVLPHFNYCSTIWNDNNKSHVDKLSKLQKKAARIITNSDYTIRSSQVFETLQWHPIKKLIDKRDLTMMFKILKNVAPNYLTTMFRKCDNSNYSLRSNNLKLSLPKPKTDFLKRSFSYRGAIAWNSLPSEFLREVDKSQTYFSFRNLLNNYYKTLE